jgi:ribosome-associated protein
MNSWIEIEPGLGLSPWELEFTYVRSSGPGGQNVNKVNTKAVMRWNVRDCTTIAPVVIARFLERYASRLTDEGVLVLTSDQTRSQSANAEDCVSKLIEMLRAVARPPKIRRPTRPTRGSVRARMKTKSRQAEKKKSRGKVSKEE